MSAHSPAVNGEAPTTSGLLLWALYCEVDTVEQRAVLLVAAAEVGGELGPGTLRLDAQRRNQWCNLLVLHPNAIEEALSGLLRIGRISLKSTRDLSARVLTVAGPA